MINVSHSDMLNINITEKASVRIKPPFCNIYGKIKNLSTVITLNFERNLSKKKIIIICTITEIIKQQIA